MRRPAWLRRRGGGEVTPHRDDEPWEGRHPRWRWVVRILALVGVLALGAAAVSLFSELGRRPGSVRATERPPVDSRAFVEGMAGAVSGPVGRGGTASLLVNGDEIFPALLADIRSARRSVNFMVYIWEPGVASDRVLAALTERARAGVQVRVLLDGFGGMNAPDSAFATLRAAGGRVGTFRPLRFGVLTRFHRRNHRRAIVIDGTVGFTGGAAVGDKWLGDGDRPEHWRDDLVRVTGPLAGSLQSAFAQSWSGATGEVLVGDAFFPPATPTTAGAATREAESDAVRITSHVNVVSSPASEAHPLRKVFWLSFASARQRLWITNPYFVPDEHLRAILKERARAGVDVRILLPGEENDAPPIRWAAQRYYGDLLEAGVRIYEYQPTFLHAKTLVVDGVWSVVGSANLDVRSKELNEENVLGMQDRDFAAQLERTFVADLRNAREIRLGEWRERGWWARVRERGTSVFSEQF